VTDTAGHPVAALDGRTRRGEATRERLLAAAIQLFGSQGFESTSMKELVRRHVIYQLEHLQLARANDLLMDADALRYLLPDAVHAYVRELLGKHLDLVTSIIDQIQRTRSGSPLPPPRLCALAVLTMCDRVLSWYRPAGALSKEQVASAYWNLVQGMLHL
jgi:hypothetical protein